MNTTEKPSRILQLSITAMVMCLIILAIFLVRIPVPFTQGYVNISDGIIFVGVMLLGRRDGCIAAALGSSIGDILGGFAMWAPWTFFIKGGMALITYALYKTLAKTKLGEAHKLIALIIAMAVAGFFMVAGYYVGEGVMYGNWIVAALGIPWNIGQFVLGIILALALTAGIKRTPYYAKMSIKI